MHLVSIIIVNFRTAAMTESCIRSIIEFTKDIDYEIVVVDNFSNDNSINYLKNVFQEFNFIRYIQLYKNIGFASANNLAASSSNSDFIFFLNPDTELKNNAILFLYEFIVKTTSEVAAVGALMKNNDGTAEISFGKFPTIQEEAFKLGYKIIFFSDNKYSSAIASETFVGEAEYVNGADFFVSKLVFQKVGPFDEKFFLYFEEADWCKRASGMGYKNFIVQGPQIIHHREKSINQLSEKNKLLIFERSRHYFFLKHYGRYALLNLKFLNILNGFKMFFWSFKFVYLEVAFRQILFKTVL